MYAYFQVASRADFSTCGTTKNSLGFGCGFLSTPHVTVNLDLRIFSNILLERAFFLPSFLRSCGKPGTGIISYSLGLDASYREEPSFIQGPISPHPLRISPKPKSDGGVHIDLEVSLTSVVHIRGWYLRFFRVGCCCCESH